MSGAITFLHRAIRRTFDDVEQGGRPSGAVAVKNGKVIATGVNRMQVVAIRPSIPN